MGNVKIKIKFSVSESIEEEDIVFDSDVRDIVKSDISRAEKKRQIKKYVSQIVEVLIDERIQELYDTVSGVGLEDYSFTDTLDYDKIIDLVEEDLRELGEL